MAQVQTTAIFVSVAIICMIGFFLIWPFISKNACKEGDQSNPFCSVNKVFDGAADVVNFAGEHIWLVAIIALLAAMAPVFSAGGKAIGFVKSIGDSGKDMFNKGAEILKEKAKAREEHDHHDRRDPVRPK